jgi:hypothetical protein
MTKEEEDLHIFCASNNAKLTQCTPNKIRVEVDGMIFRVESMDADIALICKQMLLDLTKHFANDKGRT